MMNKILISAFVDVNSSICKIDIRHVTHEVTRCKEAQKYKSGLATSCLKYYSGPFALSLHIWYIFII